MKDLSRLSNGMNPQPRNLKLLSPSLLAIGTLELLKFQALMSFKSCDQKIKNEPHNKTIKMMCA